MFICIYLLFKLYSQYLHIARTMLALSCWRSYFFFGFYTPVLYFQLLNYLKCNFSTIPVVSEKWRPCVFWRPLTTRSSPPLTGEDWGPSWYGWCWQHSLNFVYLRSGSNKLNLPENSIAFYNRLDWPHLKLVLVELGVSGLVWRLG